MNEEELKSGLKKTGIFTVLVIIFMVLLAVYVFKDSKAQKTVFDEYYSEEQNIKTSKAYMQANGVNKEDLEKLFSALVINSVNEYEGVTLSKDELENTRRLNAVASFMESYALSQVSSEEEIESTQIYDTSIVNQVYKEMFGKYVKDTLPVSTIFKYNESKNAYEAVGEKTLTGLCISIDEFEKDNSYINVKFKAIVANNDEILKYMNKEKIKLPTYEMEVKLVENEKFNYSRYFVKEVDIVSIQEVDYN